MEQRDWDCNVINEGFVELMLAKQAILEQQFAS
jgi:hypothetical protein